LIGASYLFLTPTNTTSLHSHRLGYPCYVSIPLHVANPRAITSDSCCLI